MFNHGAAWLAPFVFHQLLGHCIRILDHTLGVAQHALDVVDDGVRVLGVVDPGHHELHERALDGSLGRTPRS